MSERYDPWEHAAELEVRILFRDLPDGTWGAWHFPSRTVVLDRGLSQRERRAALAHELVHAERGDACRQDERVEAEIHGIAARRLIPLDVLGDAVCWAGDLATMADECWVDEETVRVRLEGLTEDEREDLAARHARRTA